MSVEAEAADQLWNQLVDQHMDAIWGIATVAGLDLGEAATVSQLTWLRMAERWSTVQALARAKDPKLHPVEQSVDQVDEWILHTARSEVEAWINELTRRQRDAVFSAGGVIRMAPGFQPLEHGGRG